MRQTCGATPPVLLRFLLAMAWLPDDVWMAQKVQRQSAGVKARQRWRLGRQGRGQEPGQEPPNLRWQHESLERSIPEEITWKELQDQMIQASATKWPEVFTAMVQASVWQSTRCPSKLSRYSSSAAGSLRMRRQSTSLVEVWCYGLDLALSSCSSSFFLCAVRADRLGVRSAVCPNAAGRGVR